MSWQIPKLHGLANVVIEEGHLTHFSQPASELKLEIGSKSNLHAGMPN